MEEDQRHQLTCQQGGQAQDVFGVTNRVSDLLLEQYSLTGHETLHPRLLFACRCVARTAYPRRFRLVLSPRPLKNPRYIPRDVAFPPPTRFR